MYEIVALIASYKDSASSVDLAKELIFSSKERLVCLIVDDSPDNVVDPLIAQVIKENPDLSGLIFSNYSAVKSGRGAAIRRGMEDCHNRFPTFKFLLEMDGDGSHQVKDILQLVDNRDDSLLLVGSRYLRDSRISGWPVSRRILSRLLNLIIPKIIQLTVTDVTNGLRLYPKSAVQKLLDTQAKTDSFIYLTESLLHLSGSFEVKEIPIHFVNREKGKSSVGARELVASLLGLLDILGGVKR
jgi:dolichol-phosphate mannosyltransferase